MIGVVPILQKKVLSWNIWSAGAKKFLEHPAGPFTIFFWCPLIKWGITIANIKDLDAPIKQINSYQ